VQLWDADRQDNCLCATPDCLAANNQYTQLRIEGYQPAPGSPNTIALNDFWNPTINDNYATTQTALPTGYSAATFGDGMVFKTQQAFTVPLQLYWSDKRQDMLTVASTEGIQYAKTNGYKELNATLGYVFSHPQEIGETYIRWSYSMELLNNALN